MSGGGVPSAFAIERHLRMSQRHLDLRGRGRLGPPQHLQRALVAVVHRYAVVGQDLLGEIEVLLRHHRLQHLRQLVGGQTRVHALVLVRDHDVDAIRVVADVLIDPVEFDLELFRREADGAQHAETAGLAHRDDDVAAVREGEDRELDAEFVAEDRVHYLLLRRRAGTGTCSSIALIDHIVAGQGWFSGWSTISVPDTCH